MTNEPLAGLFLTLALYLCLRLLRSDGQCLGLHLGLGLALGAALLTKASVLLTVPLVVVAPGLRLLACPRHSFADWCRAVGVVLVSCLAVCGWYYARVWARFGSPVVGNWDAAAGLTWWQEPGFRTSAFYLGFGRVLVSPLFSALHSFPDGLYSTLWGDGLISGIVRMTYRPPWNYDLMGVAYLLALGLSALLILGGALALVRFIRRPSIEWFLVLGLVAVLGLGILFMSLRVPSYAQVKAFYGFPALVPFSALVAVGWDWLRQQHRAAGTVLWALVLVWVFTVGSAFWIRHGNAVTHQVRGLHFANSGRYADAAQSLLRALQLDPNLPEAHNSLGEVLLQQGKLEEAALEFAAALKLQHDRADTRHRLGDVYLQLQQADKAINEYREALRLKTDWPPAALNNLAWLLATHPDARLRDGTQALALAQEACRLTGNSDLSLLQTLAAAQAECGQFPEAIDTARRAYHLALFTRQFAWTNVAQQRLDLYTSRKPLRQGLTP